MNTIVCIDNNNGMMFNKRRQSQDKILRENIKKLTKDSILYMNEYSYKLYKDIDTGNIKVSENFLNICNNNDYCLVENEKLSSYINKITTLIVYKWNRDYPSDFYFDIDVRRKDWMLISSEEFQGSSHNTITKEIYRRNKHE